MPIFQSLGAAKAAALPAFHALSGADNTGSFSGKGKLDRIVKPFTDVRVKQHILLGHFKTPNVGPAGN